MSAAPVAGSDPARMVVMGILNVTADSFSDGGQFLDRDAAIARGLELQRIGVDIVDVGGESTRPGATRVDPKLEADRIAPVIEELVAAGIRVSVDTMRASVAAAAIEAGAGIVNDVSGGRADPDMASVVADAGVPWILMHWRSAGDYVHRGSADQYDHVVRDVRDELLSQVDLALKAGVDSSSIILDPGLGFAKNADHNWALLRALPEFNATGFPVLVGASRKRFLGSLLSDPDGNPRPPGGRETATAVVSALAAREGAWGVRVHDAQASLDAIAVVDAWNRGRERA
ncbi:dihydropteroate synthase [Rhodococcus erythropolis]|jgi:dihydropteroate synthase|nr:MULTISPECIES: dihydropteroate synthase [Rhodococcus]MBJ7478216.1 dihydropteroate synthase [Rhodococcus sp. (in: high G+C Gram-positive bacteria)]PBI97204.1 Dihydropteroate synthase 1 [Rhodococcus erythropolis]QQM25099.1 dihydropteroate synthase [Rhodococcus sp. P-2]UJC81519.1 dihydropteroate synthase [Rhodococcus erythropolis]